MTKEIVKSFACGIIGGICTYVSLEVAAKHGIYAAFIPAFASMIFCNLAGRFAKS